LTHRLSRACRPYAKPSSISSFNRDLSDARIAEDKSAEGSGVNKSAKVVLGKTAQAKNRSFRAGSLEADHEARPAPKFDAAAPTSRLTRSIASSSRAHIIGSKRTM
jgi:hypothetical protein